MNTFNERRNSHPCSSDKLDIVNFDSKGVASEEQLLKKEAKVTESNTNEEGGIIQTEEINSTYLVYENLTERILEDPISLTKTELTDKQYKRFCRALANSMLDSIMIRGEAGTGLSSLVYYFIEENAKENSFLKDVQVISFSAITFPETSAEIAAELLNVLEWVKSQNYTKVIFFFDDFGRYPTSFWYEYPGILDTIISGAEGMEYLKTVITISDAKYYKIGDDLKCDVIESSLILNIKQEVVAEKVIQTLQPRISSFLEIHNVDLIEDEVTALVYDLCLANVDNSYASYKYFLIALEKILCWCEIEGIRKLNYEKAIEYYEDVGEDIEDEKFPYRYLNNIARHEAGHVLLALILSDFISLNGVSILKFRNINDEYTDGITITHIDERTWWINKENYTKYIAFYLAGKYSEETSDGGACDDLHMANYMAKKFVCESGLYGSLGINFCCDVDEYQNFSETTKNAIDEEVKSLLKEATVYAKFAISTNKDFISNLAKLLLEKKYLGKDEISKIWKEYGNPRLS